MSRGSHARARIATVLLAVIASGIFVVARLAPVNRDPSIFVSAGRIWVPHGSPGLTIREPVGYDGQFFFRFARNPFTRARTAFGIRLDGPSVRQQRILYPVLVWIASAGGHVVGVLWGLIVINALAIGAIALLGSLIAEDLGRSPFAGLLFAAIPGVLMGLTFDTAEPVAIAFALGGFLLLRRGSHRLAALALVAATLTRETTLLFSVGLLACVVWSRLRHRPAYEIAGARVPAWVPLAPVALYLVEQALLWAQWGRPAPLDTGQGDVGVPVIGFIRAMRDLASRPYGVRADNALFMVVILALIVLAWRSFSRSACLPHEKAAFVAAFTLTLCIQPPVWFHYASFLRGLSEVTALGLVVVLGDQDRSLVPLVVGTAPIWSYLAVRAHTLD
jgi:hypothetical protein